MKIILTFKDPDYDITGILTDRTKEVISKFVEFDEYLRIEIDTEKKTATVLEN